MNAAKMIREDYLQQNAFDEVDTYTSFSKQVVLLTNILTFDQESQKALELGTYFTEIMEGTVVLRDRIARSKFIHEDQLATIQALKEEIVETLHQIVAKGGVDNERGLKNTVLSAKLLAPLMIVDQVEGFTTMNS